MIPLWPAEEVLCAVRGQTLHAQDWTARGVAVDCGQVRQGSLFVALEPGLEVACAFEKGAAAAIVHRAPLRVPRAAPLILVEDSFAALQDLGRRGRARTGARIVDVIGGNDARASKDMLGFMLGASDDAYVHDALLRSPIDVFLSLAQIPAQSKYALFAADFAPTGDIQPHVAFVLNDPAPSPATDPFAGMDSSGIAVLDSDGPDYARLLAAARTRGLRKILSFGRHPKSDARLLSLTEDADGLTLESLVLGEKTTLRLNSRESALVRAALGAFLVCAALGADLALCRDALAAYRLKN